MFNIDFRNPKPIYEQLSDNIEKLIIKGGIKPEEQLPSVRQLAVELSLNPNTIQRAYTYLESKGLTYSVKGRGSFVSPNYKDVIDRKVNYIKQEIKKLVDEAKDIGVTEDEILKFIKGEENK